MKIYGNKPPEGQDLYIQAQKAGKKDPVQEKGTSGGGVMDRVDLSGKAKEIAEMKNTMDQLPEIRNDKVQAIQKALTDGTYKVDSRKIAGRLIDEVI
jgi:flagellar biosynthesis anti-sigma factor FlgM